LATTKYRIFFKTFQTDLHRDASIPRNLCADADISSKIKLTAAVAHPNMDEPNDNWVNSGVDNYVEVYDDDDDDDDDDMVFVWACTTVTDKYQSSQTQQPVFPDKCASLLF